MPAPQRQDRRVQEEHIMKLRYMAALAAVCSAWSLAAYADRDTGWEFGGELIYQDSTEFNADENSSASLDSDIGFALTFGYRLSSKFEITFGIDWNNIDYQADLVAEDVPLIPDGTHISVDGELEAWTPRVGANFNFIDGPITPYVSGVIGYSYIDTNIPEGPPQTGCWWDPWYGQICGTWQNTRSTEEFMYGLGAGVRWDVNDAWSVRFGYDKRWIDAKGSPDLDQIKLGVTMMY
jgi:opacity protein-like surface antigen